MGQTDTVHRTRHVDIGDHDAHAVLGFHDRDRFVRAARLRPRETMIGKHVSEFEADQRLVIHHKNRNDIGLAHFSKPGKGIGASSTRLKPAGA